MTIVDSNVLLDILGPDPKWKPWSLARLDEAADGGVAVNAVIYAEIAPRFSSRESLDDFLRDAGFELLDFSRAQLFAAGTAHRAYRRRGASAAGFFPISSSALRPRRRVRRS